MPSPKSGTPGNLVGPAEPDPAKDADAADPGQVEQVKAGQRETKSGKYGSTPVKPYNPESASSSDSGGDSDETHWIAIQLVDKNGDPVPGEDYEITLPDGSVKSGTLDDKGCARLDRIDPGQCQVSFPKIEPDAWKKA